MIVPNVEHYEYGPTPVRLRNPWPRVPHPDVLGFGSRDYGNRVGFWRMLDVFDRYQVPCTLSLNLATYEHYPEIMAACEARNWDLMCHGFYNTQYHWGLPEDEERGLIADYVATYRRLTGKTMRGWLSPANTNTLNTPDLVAEAGFTYYCDLPVDDQPFPMRVRSGRLIAMPYQFDLNDGLNFRFNMEGEEFVDTVIAMFDQLHREGAQSGRVMCLAPHPYVIGQPHRIRHFERAIRHITRHEGAWVATGAAIADWYIAHYLPLLEAQMQRGDATS